MFDETILPKSKAAPIPLKAGLDTSKYGGYSSANTSYFALIEFDGRRDQRVRNIMEVPIYVANMLEHNPNAYLEYCTNIKKLKNVRVLRACIKKNALLEIDGYPMRIRGCNEKTLQFKNNRQLVINSMEAVIQRVEKYINSNKKYDVSEKYDKIKSEECISLYDELTEKLLGVYLKRPANQGNFLRENREKFTILNLTEQIQTINGIITMLRCDIETKCDLASIGGSKNAGNMAIRKNTVGKSKLVLINQSVTGLFENRIEL